jgi:hypothetical protein
MRWFKLRASEQSECRIECRWRSPTIALLVDRDQRIKIKCPNFTEDQTLQGGARHQVSDVRGGRVQR